MDTLHNRLRHFTTHGRITAIAPSANGLTFFVELVSPDASLANLKFILIEQPGRQTDFKLQDWVRVTVNGEDAHMQKEAVH